MRSVSRTDVRRRKATAPVSDGRLEKGGLSREPTAAIHTRLDTYRRQSRRFRVSNFAQTSSSVFTVQRGRSREFVTNSQDQPM
jgi:hypothetical protein